MGTELGTPDVRKVVRCCEQDTQWSGETRLADRRSLSRGSHQISRHGLSQSTCRADELDEVQGSLAPHAGPSQVFDGSPVGHPGAMSGIRFGKEGGNPCSEPCRLNTNAHALGFGESLSADRCCHNGTASRHALHDLQLGSTATEERSDTDYGLSIFIR
jgi:hypothetical protein